MNTLLNTFGHITQLMWQRGWNEGKGGNITLRMTEAEVAEFNGEFKAGESILLNFDASEVAGEYFLCKSTGKFFRHIAADPENNLAIIRISKDGRNYVQQWGQSKPTSEIASHLLSHIVRKPLSKGAERRNYALPSDQYNRFIFCPSSHGRIIFPSPVVDYAGMCRNVSRWRGSSTIFNSRNIGNWHGYCAKNEKFSSSYMGASWDIHQRKKLRDRFCLTGNRRKIGRDCFKGQKRRSQNKPYV